MNSQRLSVFFESDRPSGDPLVPTYPYYAADVRAFAGQTVDVRFEFRLGYHPLIETKMHVIDDITFGVVPEPSAVALLVLGGAGLWWQHRRRK